MAKHAAMIVVVSALATLRALPVIADQADDIILRGTVVYDSQPYPEPNVVTLPIGKIKNESLLVNPENGGIANVVVVLTPPTNVEDAAIRPKNVAIRARDTGFAPHIVVLRPGDTLQINNTGTVGHNINVQTIRNAPINEILSPGDQSTFTPSRPERWPASLTCNIKSWMTAWIVISDSPHVAVSDENGRFQFRNVTPGEYGVNIWHEKIGAVRGIDLENEKFRPTAKGYNVQIEKGFRDLGRIAFVARQFDTD